MNYLSAQLSGAAESISADMRLTLGNARRQLYQGYVR